MKMMFQTAQIKENNRTTQGKFHIIPVKNLKVWKIHLPDMVAFCLIWRETFNKSIHGPRSVHEWSHVIFNKKNTCPNLQARTIEYTTAKHRCKTGPPCVLLPDAAWLCNEVSHWQDVAQIACSINHINKITSGDVRKPN